MHIETDYHEARELFVAEAEKAGLRAMRVRVPYENQSDLFIDFALVKRDPDRALVQLSGVHGIEGYAGSYIQRQILAKLPKEGPSLLFVHAVNPYGMALYRRANGNNVDLNRSFHDGAVKNEDYKYFDTYLNPRSGLEFYTGFLKGAYALWKLGNSRARQAVAAGQITHPKGIFFAGDGLQREVKALQDFFKSHFSGVKKLTVIDLHTGLGEFKGEMLFADQDREPESLEFFEKAFGRKTDVSSPDEGAYEIYGRISDAFRKALPKAEMRYCLQEFGTVRPSVALKALRMENFDWHSRPAGTLPSPQVQEAMLEAFMPSSDEWREHIVKLGVERWFQAWKACQN